MKRNIISVVLTLCAVLLLVPLVANASAEKAGNLTWDCSEYATLVISGNGPMDDYEMYNKPWHFLRGEIKEVIIKSGVTSIGDYAFWDFPYLESVVIPSSVTSIGDYAFANTNLKSVTVPNTVTTIGWGAFSSCEALTSVKLSGKLEVIEEDMFGACISLKTVTIPSSVTAIKIGAFSGCEKLSSITIPNSVATIEDMAFSDCTSLKTVSIGNGLTAIGTDVFTGCSALTKFTVNSKNDSFSSDSKGALYNKNKTVLHLVPQNLSGKFAPDAALITIAPMAFYECNGLTQVQLGKNVAEIDPTAFVGCSAAYTVDAANPACFADEKGVLFCDGVLVVAPMDLSGEYRVPDGIETIGKYAFLNHEGLVSVIFGKDVTCVEEHSFTGCSALTTLSIPKNTKFQGSNFRYCNSMKDVYYRGNKEAWDAINPYSDVTSFLRAYLRYMDAPPAGDMDDDWMLSTDDAVYLLLSVMFGETDYPVPAGTDLDFNADGKTDTNDAVYLLLNIMFGAEDYPLAA